MLAVLTTLSTTLLVAFIHGTSSVGTLSGVIIAALGVGLYTMSKVEIEQVEIGRKVIKLVLGWRSC